MGTVCEHIPCHSPASVEASYLSDEGWVSGKFCTAHAADFVNGAMVANQAYIRVFIEEELLGGNRGA